MRNVYNHPTYNKIRDKGVKSSKFLVSFNNFMVEYIKRYM